MVTSMLVRVVLVALFALAGGYCVVRCVAARHPAAERLADAGQAVMCGGMLAMAVGVAVDRWGLLSGVLAVPAGWQLVRAVGPAAGGAATRIGLFGQALMLAGTGWMLMPPLDTAAPMPSTRATVSLAGALAVTTLWWADRSIRGVTGTGRGAATCGPRRRMFDAAGTHVCQAVMSGAMSLALFAMVR